MHVCALMRAYRGMWSFLSLFVFTLSLQKLPRHTSRNCGSSGTLLKESVFWIVEQMHLLYCKRALGMDALSEWPILYFTNELEQYLTVHISTTMSLCYQRGLRYVLQIHLHSCMWLVLPPEGRYAAANDKVWERQSEGKRWMWMICGIMLLRGFNVTSGPSICLSCRWQQ